MSRRLLPLLALVLAALATFAAVAGAQGGRPAEYTIPGDQVFPEGIATEPGSRAFFVGSTTDGTIFRGDVRRPALEPFAPAGADGRTTAVGLKADGRGRLFVAGGGTGRLFVLSTRDGSTRQVLGQTPAPPEASFFNDIALTRDAAYVTDSLRPILFRAPLRPRGEPTGVLEPWLDFTGTALQYQQGFNLNGIVPAKGGRVLITVQSNTGKLFRIDTGTKAVAEIDLGGATLTNGDGLLLQGRTLYVVRNRQELIVPVRLSRDLRRGWVGNGITSEALRFPTTIASDGRRLLAVNSQFDRRGPGLTPELPFTVSALEASGRGRR
jgi:Cu-Zn family superoxide dismutase